MANLPQAVFQGVSRIAVLGQISLVLLLGMQCQFAWAQSDRTPPTTPRQTESGKSADVFFEDAFEQAIRGKRPRDWSRMSPVGKGGSLEDRGEDELESTFRWSRLITSSSLEDGVKSLRLALDQSITNPAEFAAESSRNARRELTMLACLFTIIDQFDGQVRWKQEAAAARDLCRLAALAAKQPDRAGFEAASAAKEQVAELVRGGRLDVSTDARTPRWDEIATRSELMIHLDKSLNEVIRPATANSNELDRQSDRLRREAELMAAIAEILTREAMDDATDDDYVAYCRELQQAALAIRSALESSDAQATKRASTAVGRSCVACHEDYRG